MLYKVCLYSCWRVGGLAVSMVTVVVAMGRNLVPTGWKGKEAWKVGGVMVSFNGLRLCSGLVVDVRTYLLKRVVGLSGNILCCGKKLMVGVTVLTTMNRH